VRKTPDATLYEVVRLRRLKMTHKEIARKLGIAHGVVQRAIENLAPDLVRGRTFAGPARAAWGTRLSSPFHQDEFKHWTGKDAPPVREQPVMPGSCVRPLTQFELMTGRRRRCPA
jgi:hypothetical protein